MRYLRINKPGEIALCEKEMPAPQKGTALLRLLYGGICGSDVGTYKGTFAYAAYPRIPGHEMSCEIAEVGDNEFGLRQGMIVTCNPYFNCGKCYSCRRGFVNCCEHNETMGVQRDGAFCEYIRMPVERIYDGKGLDPVSLALIEPFCISSHAVSRLGVKPGEKVFVAGAGTIGIFALIAAKQAGAQVYISDIVPEKRSFAVKMGADGVIAAAGEDFDAAVKDCTDGSGFDVCIEAAGVPSAFMACIQAAAYRARIGVVGISKQSMDFNYSLIQKKELDVFGSRNALKEDFVRLIDSVSKGHIPLKAMVSGIFDMEDAGRAFEALACGAPALKYLIRF